MTRLLRNRDAWAVCFLLGWPFLYFWQIPLGQGVWFTRDVSRVYHPFAVELSRALSEGRLPLWTPNLEAGFPLFAEGQVAALYPIHLLFLTLFPPEFAISLETLLHLAWAAIGMYAFVRGMRFMIPSAIFAGIAFSFTGFMIQKVYHMPILWTAAWLPWCVFLLDRFQGAQREHRNTAGVWFLLATLALGVQWLCGSVQISLLNYLVVACVGFFGGLIWNLPGEFERKRIRAIPQTMFWILIPLLVGGGLAAVQLLPTAELVGNSVRAGGLNDKLLTLYSYSADSIRQFVIPFSQGEPSDDNVELWGYIGITTLICAAMALCLRRRDARTIFFSLFALVAVSLTLGDANPAFRFIVQLPVFNLFRVPARYVFPFAFATALLAAITVEEFARRSLSPRSHKSTIVVVVIVAAAIFAIIGLTANQSLEFWFSAWQFLPYLLALLVAVVMALARTKRIDRGVFGAAMVGLVLIDLAAYAAPFLSTTVARLSPPAYVNQVPRSAGYIGTGPEAGRVFTDETLWPSVPALRSSIYPNFGLVYGREGAHIYSPLALAANEDYFFNLSPTMLNLLNARYFSVPLEPRAADRATTPYGSLALDVLGDEAAFAPTAAVSIQIDSFTEGMTDKPKGSIVANVLVRLDDGSTRVFPLRSGIETADWDWAPRHDTTSPPGQTLVAHPVPGFVRSLGHAFDGYVYRAQFKIDGSGRSRKIVGIRVEPVDVAPARLSIERISLIDESGHSSSVAGLTGKNDFALSYMSDTAAIWENLNVLPRAFLVHQAEQVSRNRMLRRLSEPGFRADQTILLESTSLSAPASASHPADHVEITRYRTDSVSLSVATDQSGYLFLGDSWYPGWNALMDGKPTTIYLADSIFRAIQVEPGQHSILFEYRPVSLILGGAVSGLCLIIASAVAWVLSRNLRAGRSN